MTDRDYAIKSMKEITFQMQVMHRIIWKLQSKDIILILKN